jgi:hypothetical protein
LIYPPDGLDLPELPTTLNQRFQVKVKIRRVKKPRRLSRLG